MKLKNKKTGEIDDFIFEVITDRIDLYRRVGHSETKNIWHYNSLAELEREWEDYEEPKDFWYIGDLMIICGTEGEFTTPDLASFTKKDIEKLKAIGNYFESKEEAEKAVEKLKAWKRLRDKGFRFIDHIDRDSGQGMTRYEWDGYVNGEDLDLLFGGEE